MDPLENREELERDAPTLFGLDKSDPFEVPGGFFEYFPHNLQEKVREVKSGVEVPFWKGLVIALPLVIVIVAVTGILITMTNVQPQKSLGELSEIPIEDVIEYEDPEELLALLTDSELPDAEDIVSDLDEIDWSEEYQDEDLESYMNGL